MAVDLALDNSELAKSYDELSDSQFNNGLALLEKLEVTPGMKVLDIGCGTGGWVAMWSASSALPADMSA